MRRKKTTQQAEREEADDDVEIRTDIPATQQQFAQLLIDGIEAGDSFDSGSAVCQRMKRKMTNQENQEYKSCKSDNDRKAFRVSWGKRQLEGLTISKSKTRAWRKIEEEKGEYLTIASISIKFGHAADPETSMNYAIAYCRRCAELGGQWLKTEPFSKTQLFLFVCSCVIGRSSWRSGQCTRSIRNR